ncbi:hypothetical protein IDJ77_08245 [Mucilaginibacter sp. ZT4R22]|uniref:PKD domain-containing protein n=1 Tax=Mucilaginibacter pankratovii TaxID=2772110 RepID=A0ABR7WR27_9SPHI|nr:PKD domain-containing protein [Mucilaginibacter pankratovii]MBD1363799.1 hypothetical protein [Mucilaginibacter pankratovii]
MLKYLILPFFWIFAVSAVGQVTVNPLTGAAAVDIPIYTLSSGQVSASVSLSYSTSGVKPKDVEGTAGLGWNVIAGGAVSRELRGLPDDVTKDNSTPTALDLHGWMSFSPISLITGFTIANDNNFATCTDESNDNSYINTNLSTTNDDREPDLFTVSAPGLSCQMIFDKATNQFKLVNYQDLAITYTTHGGSGSNSSLINSFTITTDRGIKYNFSAPQQATVKTVLGSGTATYFATKYNNYKNGVTFYNSWNLISITDPLGNGIQFNYLPTTVTYGTDPVILHLSGSSSQSIQYYVQSQISSQLLSTINTFNVSTTFPGLTFYRNDVGGFPTSQTGQLVIREIIGLGRDFILNYSPVAQSTTGFRRLFLRGITEAGCSSPVNYSFTYDGENLSTNTTLLPDSTSNNIDYWGYYTGSGSSSLVPKVWVNPFNAGYPRYAIYNPATGAGGYVYSTSGGVSRTPVAPTGGVSIGCLSGIKYAQGGTTSVLYEYNTYYDLPSAQSVAGGGVRVKQVTDYDGISTANNMVRNYTYTLPGTSNSSGRPISLPAFAFSVPSTTSLTGQSLWDYITVLSEYDMSNDDHTIMYTDVTMSQANAGSTLYQYYVPATHWDLGSAPVCSGCATEWANSKSYVARNSCTATDWNIKNDFFSYPFPPNPNYDFERGLIKKVTNFSGAGIKVSESNYTYSRSNAINSVTAYKADNLAFGSLSAKAYSKYTVYYNTSELVTQVSNTVYDSPTLSQAQTSTTNYTYNSPYHKLLTQEQTTNSNGSIYTTNFTYVKDYPAAGNGGTASNNVKALYNMQQSAVNTNYLVETYQQITKGGITSTTVASLTLYSPVTLGSNTRYLPAQQLKLVSPDGIPSTPSPFVPYSVTSTTGTYDTRYFVTGNVDKYDNYGIPVTTNDNNRNFSTALTDHLSSKRVASFSNAKSSEVAYTDFDTDPGTAPGNSFTVSGTGSFTPLGSHAGNAYGLPANTKTFTSPALSRSLMTKSFYAGSTQYYNIFSVWINGPAKSNTLYISLNGGSAVGYTYTGTGDWKYYEFRVNVTSMPSPPSTFTVSFTSSDNISVDDILLYPEASEASTVTYDPVYHYKVAQTNTNGVSEYFENDQWGRVLKTKDQDKNITQRNYYVTPADAQPVSSLVISLNSIAIHGTPTTLSVSWLNSCAAAGLTVDWNFGDLSTVNGYSGLTSPGHTYAAAGTYTVNATVHSPLFGNITLAPLTITVAPASLPLSYISYTFGNGDITSVTFYQGSTLKYTFTGAQLNTATILQGNYTIYVSLSGGSHYNSGTGLGYNSVTLSGDCAEDCKNWVSNNTYSFTMNLSNCNNLGFTVSQFACGI